MANVSVRLPVCNGQDLEANLEQVMHQAVPSGTVIADREKAYAINMEFDRIRDILMQDPAVWEQYKFCYWQKKYLSYQAVCGCLNESLQGEFRCRMRQEFKRAMQLGQLRRADFSPAQWRDIRHMVDEALGYVGLRGALRRASPYAPSFIKRALSGVLRMAANTK